MLAARSAPPRSTVGSVDREAYTCRHRHLWFRLMHRLAGMAAVSLLLTACGTRVARDPTPATTPTAAAPPTRAATAEVRTPVEAREVTRTIRGRFVLRDNSNPAYATHTIAPIGKGGCARRLEYDDIRLWAQVVVRSGGRRAEAKGQLENGTLRGISTPNATCTFSFTVRDVPRADVYVIAIAQRGEVLISDAEATNPGSHLLLELGSRWLCPPGDSGAIVRAHPPLHPLVIGFGACGRRSGRGAAQHQQDRHRGYHRRYDRQDEAVEYQTGYQRPGDAQEYHPDQPARCPSRHQQAGDAAHYEPCDNVPDDRAHGCLLASVGCPPPRSGSDDTIS